MDALARTLENMNVEYDILSNTTADVFAKINISQLILALANEKCEVISLQERDETLESYYVNLVGGASHE